MSRYREISKCRICDNSDLVPIIHLGTQCLTGVFPKSRDDAITSGPLEVVKCHKGKDGNHCGLVQLRHSYDSQEMYENHYGYRSGLNPSMVDHLQKIVKRILERITLLPGDLVIDIGSNDGTLLQVYPAKDIHLLGIDPAGKQFRPFYPDDVQLIPDFFSSTIVKAAFGRMRAKIVTSIAMLYDLENPLDFMQQVYDVLDDNGIWVFEQSYLSTMLEMNAYDTICHEHIEYYRLQQIKWLTDRAGFKILDVDLNSVNGGSFCVTAAKSNSAHRENSDRVQKLLSQEKQLGLDTLEPYMKFCKRVYNHRDELCQLIYRIKVEGKLLIGYGASTKGNVILQFCRLTANDIPYIAEVNTDKFGCFTPGTLIPIISEAEARTLKPDYKIVLPWHFKDTFLAKERDYLASGGKLVFPLPSIETVQ
jgi:NDP-4-keto-2,6-dideoxyhexose 3-C-methyltransferase